MLSEAAVLLHRGFLYILRNPGLYWVRLAMYTILAFVLGTLYWRQPFTVPTIQDRISLLFFGTITSACILLTCVSCGLYGVHVDRCATTVYAMLHFSTTLRHAVLLDKPVFVRERASGSYGPRMRFYWELC